MMTASALVANRKMASKRATINYINNKDKTDDRAYDEHEKERRRKYRAENREYCNKRMMFYYENHREQHNERARKYRKEHPDMDKENHRARSKKSYQIHREEKIAKQLEQYRAKKEAGYRYRRDPVTKKYRWVFVGN